MNTEERIQLLQDAQGLIYEAIEAIRTALHDTRELRGAESYVLAELAMCAGEEHQYIGQQPYNLDELIRAFSGENEDNDEE